MKENAKKIVLTVLLFLLVVIPVYSETADQCTARLSQNISIATYAEAAAWWAQVERECAPLLEEEEKLLILTSDTLGEWHTLSNSGCQIKYVEQPDIKFETTLIIPYVRSGNPRLYYRSSDGWTQMQGSEDDLYMAPLVFGVGLHEFEVKTKKGEDLFAVRETWAATFIVNIWCS